MKNLYKIIFIIIPIITNMLHANTLEDKAFNEYKNHNYKKSVMLYRESAKSNNLKSILMLGLFSEQGIGVQKDTNRAIKFYKYIIKRTKDIKSLVNNPDKLPKIDITIAALKRIYALTGNKSYHILSQKLEKIKGINSKPKSDKAAIDLFNKNHNSSVDDFIVLCPPAKVVAPEDREGLESFDCSLFENFPKRMALFMKLRRIRFEEMATHKRGEEFLNRLNSQITKLVKPMVKFLQQASIDCYSIAQTNMDIKACDYDYLLKSDPLIFDNAAYRMEVKIKNSNENTYPIGNFKRDMLVSKLIDKISNNAYGKPYRIMVKY